MLQGIIDIGSTSIRLAIYLIDGGHIEQIMKRKHTVGLASYIEDGEMSSYGIDKATDILLEFKNFLQQFDIKAVRAFATAALRNVRNSREAVGEIERRTGISIQVISGDEEAYYDFVGATHNLSQTEGLLVDIGGGSTEIVSYQHSQIMAKISLPIGSLAFYKHYVAGLLPTVAETIRMGEVAEKALVELEDFQTAASLPVVGIGGTFKAASALYNGLFGQPGSNNRIQVNRLPAIIGHFQSDHGISEEMSIMLMRTAPDRIHTVIPGLVIATALARRFAVQTITYSDSGVREGFIYSEIVDRA